MTWALLMMSFIINVVWSIVLVWACLRAWPHAICEPDRNNSSARARPQRNKRKPVKRAKGAVLESGLAAAPARPSSPGPSTSRAKVYKASQPSGAAVRERVREWLLRVEGKADQLRIRDTQPNAPANVPQESTDSSEEEVLPFGPLRRPDSTRRLVALPRSKSFERMTTNDRQPPPTPLRSVAKSHSSVERGRRADAWRA